MRQYVVVMDGNGTHVLGDSIDPFLFVRAHLNVKRAWIGYTLPSRHMTFDDLIESDLDRAGWGEVTEQGWRFYG